VVVDLRAPGLLRPSAPVSVVSGAVARPESFDAAGGATFFSGVGVCAASGLAEDVEGFVAGSPTAAVFDTAVLDAATFDATVFGATVFEATVLEAAAFAEVAFAAEVFGAAEAGAFDAVLFDAVLFDAEVFEPADLAPDTLRSEAAGAVAFPSALSFGGAASAATVGRDVRAAPDLRAVPAFTAAESLAPRAASDDTSAVAPGRVESTISGPWGSEFGGTEVTPLTYQDCPASSADEGPPTRCVPAATVGPRSPSRGHDPDTRAGQTSPRVGDRLGCDRHNGVS
jgi:hypothetical protein